MRFNAGIALPEGKAITNLTAPSGATFPEPASNGELFIIDDPENLITDGLYWFSGKLNNWVLLVPIFALDAAVTETVTTAISTAVPAAVSEVVSNTPAKIPAVIGTETYEATSIEFSSTIRGSVTQEGKLVIEYAPSRIELTMASPIDINTSEEIEVPFSVISTQDTTVFSFAAGTPMITVEKHGLYDISYQINSMIDNFKKPNASTKTSNVNSYIKVNGSNISRKSSSYSYISDGETDNTTNTGSCVIELNPGDYVTLCCKGAGRNAITRLIEEETLLSIMLLKELG